MSNEDLFKGKERVPVKNIMTMKGSELYPPPPPPYFVAFLPTFPYRSHYCHQGLYVPLNGLHNYCNPSCIKEDITRESNALQCW